MEKFVFNQLKFDDENKKQLSVNEIITDGDEARIPSERDGVPVTHIGFNSEYEEARQVWIDYQHFKDEIIPGGWRQYSCKVKMPKTLKRLYLPDTVALISLYFYQTNKDVEVVISDSNPNKKSLLSDLEYAKRQVKKK